MDSSSTQESSLSIIPSNNTTATNAIDQTPSLPSIHNTYISAKASWMNWYAAFKNILPTYILIHLAFFVITCLAVLFTLKDFSPQSMSISTLWQSWLHWDTINFRAIAANGYTMSRLTAFFPLYPLLERSLTFLTHDYLIAGLIISNLSGLGMLVILYRLVQEDFDAERAFRTVLYLSVFPTAFFFVAAYNESLFLLLTLLSFYHMRRGNWWLAGLFGLLASLTRSVGIVLFLPFCYEYLRQHQFSIKKVRFTAVSSLAIPAGLAIFALYCYYKFHDPLSFSHAQVVWKRHLYAPWSGLINSFGVIFNRHVLSFDSIHNVIDLSACLFILALVV